MDDLTALRRTYEQAEKAVAGVGSDAMTAATPCSKWDVRTLLNHMVAVLLGFPVALAGERPDWAAEVLGADPVRAFVSAAEANLAAWRAPGAAVRPSPKLPGMHLIDVNLVDTLTHTWDLLVATGQPVVLDDDLVRHVYQRWRATPLESSRAAGAFGPEVPLPLDAPALDPVYEWADDDLGPVLVTDKQGRRGRFDRNGRWLLGDVRRADPELCRWIVMAAGMLEEQQREVAALRRRRRSRDDQDTRPALGPRHRRPERYGRGRLPARAADGIPGQRALLPGPARPRQQAGSCDAPSKRDRLFR